ncbi:hypothetical protein ACI2LM_23720 [Paenibacillus lautus]|uniref:hypothetical protein n=1 Tax=Paenibacillus lautus TaxID=1401 RepID=UPI00384E5C70
MSNVNGVFSGQFSAEMKGGGSGLLQYGLVDVTTAGSQVQLPNIPCREVTIIAKDSNNGFIYVGGQGISSINYGVKLKADGSITLPVNNANLIHINASVDGEGVSYVAL